MSICVSLPSSKNEKLETFVRCRFVGHSGFAGTKRRKKVLVLAIQRPGEAIKIPNMMALTIPTIDLRLPARLKRKYGGGLSSAANMGLQVIVTAEVEKY